MIMSLQRLTIRDQKLKHTGHWEPLESPRSISRVNSIGRCSELAFLYLHSYIVKRLYVDDKTVGRRQSSSNWQGGIPPYGSYYVGCHCWPSVNHNGSPSK